LDEIERIAGLGFDINADDAEAGTMQPNGYAASFAA
jgi:hypothetical protein